MEYNFIIFIVGIILCSLGFLLALSLLIFNIRFMNLRFIKMTSPRVNIFLVFGTLALYASSLLMVLPSDSWSTDVQMYLVQCRYWLLAMGFTIVFGSMLVKGWRVHRLFQYPRTSTVTIKDGSLFGGVVVLLLLDLGLLTVWQVIDPVTCTAGSAADPGQTPNRFGNGLCTSGYYSIWMIVLMFYKYIIIFMCCYVGWQIRHISFAALDDSRCLLLSSGITLTLTGAAAILIMFHFSYNPLAVFSILSIAIWIGTTAVLLLIFMPKVAVVYKSGGWEPLMGSASKYVQQPVSSDVGEEFVKILGENRHLKHKLEERDILVSYLKKKLSSSISADTESQQTSSANYSLTSTTTTALTRPRSRSTFCQSFNCFSTCCDDGEQSMKAAQGSPIGDHDLSIASMKTLDLATMPTVYGQCSHPYIPQSTDNSQQARSEKYSIISPVLPIVTISHASSPRDCTQIAQAEHRIVTDGVEIDSTEHVTVTPATPALTHRSDDLYINDIQLICTIADTYDLGADSDALSYISNCLNTNKSRTLQRKPHHKSQSTMLSSDQLYPDSMLSQKRNTLKPPKKQIRRKSIATANNVYMNDRGKPLII